MSQDLFTETVARYRHLPDPETLEPINVDVVGCMDDETPAGEFMFFDLFEFGADGNCLNEGDPFPKQPERREVAEYLILKYILALAPDAPLRQRLMVLLKY